MVQLLYTNGQIPLQNGHDKFTIDDIFSMWIYVIHPETMDQYLGTLGSQTENLILPRR